MKQGLALFDFDGTITTRDTMFEFIKYHKGIWLFVGGMVWLSPIVLLLVLRVVSAKKAKEAVMTFFFKNTPTHEFDRLCFLFVENRLPHLLKPDALRKIEWHKKSGHRVVVVTASPENWVRDWCEKMSIELIGTQLEIVADRITGKLSSENCNGSEKVFRIVKHLSIEQYQPIYAYGNSRGDREMLKLAEYPSYKPF